MNREGSEMSKTCRSIGSFKVRDASVENLVVNRNVGPVPLFPQSHRLFWAMVLSEVFAMTDPVGSQLDAIRRDGVMGFPADSLGTACFAAANMYNFGCSYERNYTCLCTTTAYVDTVVYCMGQWAQTFEERESARQIFNSVCELVLDKSLSSYAFDERYVNASKHLEDGRSQPDWSIVHSQPVKMPTGLVNEYLQISTTVNTNRANSTIDGAMLYVYVFGLVLLLDVRRWLRRLCFGRSYWFARPRRWLHCIELKSPNMTRMLMVLGYLALHGVLLGIKFDLFTNNRLPEKGTQLAKLLGDRSGVLAIMQMPMAVFFSSRYQVFSTLAGMSFRQMEALSRFLEFNIFLDLIVHAATYTALSLSYQTYRRQWQLSYWILGVISMLVFTVYFLDGFFTRHRRGGLGSFFHLVLFLGFSITMCVHVQGFGYAPYCAGTFAPKVIDWILHVLRIATSGKMLATIRLNRCGMHENLELIVRYSSIKPTKMRPGMFGYVHIKGWSGLFKQSKLWCFEAISAGGDSTLKMLAHVDDITPSRLTYLRRHPHSSANVSVLFEGRYGLTQPIHLYSDVVFVCEDLWFGLAYSYALDLKKRIDGDYVVLFLWIVKDDDMLTQMDTEISLLSGDPKFEVRTYTTVATSAHGGAKEIGGVPPRMSIMSDIELRDRPRINLQPVHLNNSYAFPDLTSIAHLRIRQASSPLCFASACSKPIERTVRHAVAAGLPKAHSRVDYYNLAI